MRSSLFTRMFAWSGIIAVALALIISSVSFRAVRAFYIDSLRSDLLKLARSLEHRLVENSADGASTDSLVKVLGAAVDARVTVVAPDGTVLGDSEEDPAGMENHRSRPEILKAFGGEPGSSLRYSNTVKTDMLYVAEPLRSDTGITGVVRVSLYLSDIETLLASLKQKITLTVLVALLVALTGTILVTRSVSGPVAALRHAAARIAAGDFSARVLLKKDNEFKELGDGFNTMAAEVQGLVGELSRQKEELNAIITSLSEGLLVLDNDGRVIRYNPAFAELAGTVTLERRCYWEVLRNPQLNEFIKVRCSGRQSGKGEFELDDRIYLCSLAILAARGVAVVVFHDITQIRRMERVKKEFVTNVSHELRTPLTAIKGFVETLEDGVEGDQKHYVEVISRHTDRLINIVQDLLHLSELEDGRTVDETADVDLKPLLSDTMQIFEQRAAGKNIRMLLDVPAGLPPVRGDAFRLQQVFVNLVDNAVKYTEQGTVTVSAAPDINGVAVEVRDTGIGIPAAYTGRLFERFYVVDKSRSRQSGGTGLGLAIVKHIVAAHNGTITVESTPGEGTAFTVVLTTRDTDGVKA